MRLHCLLLRRREARGPPLLARAVSSPPSPGHSSLLPFVPLLLFLSLSPGCFLSWTRCPVSVLSGEVAQDRCWTCCLHAQRLRCGGVKQAPSWSLRIQMPLTLPGPLQPSGSGPDLVALEYVKFFSNRQSTNSVSGVFISELSTVHGSSSMVQDSFSAWQRPLDLRNMLSNQV